MFTLSSAAARQIRQAASASGAQQMVLRIAAKLDADGSLQYGMGFDEPKEEDMKLEIEGVAVVIGGESQELLFDTLLDYVELTPGEFNFIFSNGRETQGETEPGAGAGCAGCSAAGCGTTGRTH